MSIACVYCVTCSCLGVCGNVHLKVRVCMHVNWATTPHAGREGVGQGEGERSERELDCICHHVSMLWAPTTQVVDQDRDTCMLISLFLSQTCQEENVQPLVVFTLHMLLKLLKHHRVTQTQHFTSLSEIYDDQH